MICNASDVKKTNLSSLHTEGSSSSIVGKSTYSDLDMNDLSKRKANMSTPFIKQKGKRNSGMTRQLTEKTENANHIDSVKQSESIVTTVLVNETNRKRNIISKEKKRGKHSKLSATKRNSNGNLTPTSPLCSSNESFVSVFDVKSTCSDSCADIAEKTCFQTNLKVTVGDTISSSSLFNESFFSVKPSRSFSFETINSNNQNSHVDYLKEFDFIRNLGLYNQHEESMKSTSEKTRGVFSLVPTISPSSKPVFSKKRTGILSVKDSKRNSSEMEQKSKESNFDETRISLESDESDISLTSRESIGNVKDLHSSDKDDNNVLNLKRPIRIKYIDEDTKKLREIIIYTEDHLSNISNGQGDMASNEEVFEKLLQQTAEYKGVNLRVILDAEKFLNKLHKRSKSLGDIKASSSLKVTKETLLIKNSRSVNATKKSSTAPRQTISCHSLSTNHHTNRWKTPPKPKHIRESKIPVSLANVGSTKIDKFHKKVDLNQSKKATKNKQENQRSKNRPDENHEAIDGRQPRISLKKFNVEEIINSDFSSYFHFYAKLGGRLKSGAVISRKNSSFWLKKCGVINDILSENMADSCFMAMARNKCVLNISDYVQYLIKIAKEKRFIVTDLIQKLKSIDLQSVKKLSTELLKSHSTKELNSKGLKTSKHW